MSLIMLEKDIIRFWSKVNKTSEDECWEWLGYKRRGYGQMNISKKTKFAHRISYMLVNGFNSLDNLNACHKCDNPSCVNPNHLFAGTQLDNVRDMISKGRKKSITKTHCIRGHELIGDNVFYRSNGFKVCKLCTLVHNNKHYRKKQNNGNIIAFKDRTHCPKGHEYTLQNTYITSKGRRQCRECNKIRSRIRSDNNRILKMEGGLII